jgi:hypothetical protein
LVKPEQGIALEFFGEKAKYTIWAQEYIRCMDCLVGTNNWTKTHHSYSQMASKRLLTLNVFISWYKIMIDKNWTGFKLLSQNEIIVQTIDSSLLQTSL